MAARSTRSPLEVQSQYWCLTIFNPRWTGADYWEKAGVFAWDRAQQLLGANYILGGLEYTSTPSSDHPGGTPHIQLYAEYPKKKLGSAVQKAMMTAFGTTSKPHLAVARGTAAENKVYCHKEKRQVYEYGSPIPRAQGSRTDIEALRDAVRAGADDAELWDEFPTLMCRYPTVPKAVRAAQCVPRKKDASGGYPPVEIWIFWGAAGSGKTLAAMEFSSEMIRLEGKFITGYTGTQDTVVFDEFDVDQTTGAKTQINFMKTLTDRYPTNVSVLNQVLPWNPKRIIFTCNTDPQEWWSKAREIDRQALQRRWTLVREFTAPEGAAEEVFAGRGELHKYLVSQTKLTSIAGPSAPRAAASTAIAAGGSDSDDDSDSGKSAYSIEQRKRQAPKGKEPALKRACADAHVIVLDD